MENADTPAPSRRDFLTYSTVGVGLVTVAAAVNGLTGTLAAPAVDNLTLDLSDIPEGTEISAKFAGRPIVIRHRTQAEIAAAEADDLTDFIDPLARNPNRVDSAPATDRNRRATADGRFIVMSKVCPHLGCIVLGASGDFVGYFCPCHGAHFDTSGRVRKGPPPRNLSIPSFIMPDSNTLILLQSPPLPEPKLDAIIYGTT